MKTIILGYNGDGQVRYIQTTSANGARATGITSEKKQATVFDSWQEASEFLLKTELYKTWRYSWMVREVIVKPCGE